MIKRELIHVYHGFTCLTILLNGKVARLFAGKGETIQQKEKTKLRRGEGWPGRQEKAKAGKRDLRNGQLRKPRQGEKNKEPRCVRDPAVHLSHFNAALSIGTISKVHRDGPREETCTCPWENKSVRRKIPLRHWQFSFCTCQWMLQQDPSSSSTKGLGNLESSPLTEAHQHCSCLQEGCEGGAGKLQTCQSHLSPWKNY